MHRAEFRRKCQSYSHALSPGLLRLLFNSFSIPFSRTFPPAVAPQLMPFSFGEGSLTAGQPITVQCMIVDGDLPMTLRWMFHGKELSSQMGISTFLLNPRVSLLSIDAVAAGHAGDYTCTAKNSAGQTNHTASLFVNGKNFCLLNPSSSTPNHAFQFR